MKNDRTTEKTVHKRPRVPRGLRRDGAALWSYGFRPFFLGGAVWAAAAMVLWMVALATGWFPGDDGPLWHAHEMVYGFAPAVLAGFLMTLLPNWSGHLPVSGRPLMAMVALWGLGRLAMAGGPWIGMGVAASIDALFLPVLLAVAAREIIAGRKRNDVKLLFAIGAIALGNIGFHLSALSGGDAMAWARAGVAGFVLLVMIMGGRLVPSFTRNLLKRRKGAGGQARMPVPYGRTDVWIIALSLLPLALWVVLPTARVTGALALVAGVLNLVRLWRWRGWAVRGDWLTFAMHVAFFFIPLGFLAIAAAGGGLLLPASALHVLTVGVIGGMMMAVMMRATRSHTGHALVASRMSIVAGVAVFLAAILRPLADVADSMLLMEVSGLAWTLGFALFCVEYGPMLVLRRRKLRGDG